MKIDPKKFRPKWSFVKSIPGQHLVLVVQAGHRVHGVKKASQVFQIARPGVDLTKQFRP
jgi:hypothetical protein